VVLSGAVEALLQGIINFNSGVGVPLSAIITPGLSRRAESYLHAESLA